MFEILFVGLAVRYGRQQQVPPGQRVTDREVQQHNLQVGVGAQALKKDTAVVDFARIPAVPSAARDVVEGEVGGAGYSAAGGSARMGRLGGFEAAVVFVDEAEDERRVERPVETEEDGVGYEAVEGDACGGDAGQDRRGGDPDKDLRQEVVGRQRASCLRRRAEFGSRGFRRVSWT